MVRGRTRYPVPLASRGPRGTLVSQSQRWQAPDARASGELVRNHGSGYSTLTKAFLNCNELPKSELCAVRVASSRRRESQPHPIKVHARVYVYPASPWPLIHPTSWIYLHWSAVSAFFICPVRCVSRPRTLYHPTDTLFISMGRVCLVDRLDTVFIEKASRVETPRRVVANDSFDFSPSVPESPSTGFSVCAFVLCKSNNLEVSFLQRRSAFDGTMLRRKLFHLILWLTLWNLWTSFASEQLLLLLYYSSWLLLLKFGQMSANDRNIAIKVIASFCARWKDTRTQLTPAPLRSQKSRKTHKKVVRVARNGGDYHQRRNSRAYDRGPSMHTRCIEVVVEIHRPDNRWKTFNWRGSRT